MLSTLKQNQTSKDAIILVGESKHGKSTFINYVSNNKQLALAKGGFKSCTLKCQPYYLSDTKLPGIKNICFIDTIGIFGTD